MEFWETAAVGDLIIGKQGFNRKKSITSIVTVSGSILRSSVGA
jgi:hypothetical protein